MNIMICTYTEGDDYNRVSDSLRMESGFTAGSCSPLILSVIKDGVLESDETFQLLTDASGPAVPSPNNGGTTRITIVDDDSACEYHVCMNYLNLLCIITVNSQNCNTVLNA